MNEYNRPHYLENKITFGKHRGKSIIEIYCGINEITEQDLLDIFVLFGETEITPSKSIHIIHGLLKDGNGGESLIPSAQRLLLKYLPDPEYIDWCILNIDEFKLLPSALSQLEDLEIKTLVKITKIEDHLIPIFETSKRSFGKEVSDKNNKKTNNSTDNVFELFNRFSNTEEKEDNSNNYYYGEHGRYEDNFCPACQETRPCGCNYSIENDY